MKISWDKFFTMCIFGLPGSGKTNLLRYLVFSGAKNKQFDHCLLFSATKDTDDYDFLDPKYKYDAYDESVIEKYMDICQKTNEKEIKTRGLIIFDDICGSQTFKSPLFKRLFSNYRHAGISVILCQQMIVELPLSIRSIIKYYFIYKYVNEADREKVYNSVGSLTKNKKEFYEIYEKYTNEKYKCLFYSSTDVYDNSSPYSGARAPMVKPFKLSF